MGSSRNRKQTILNDVFVCYCIKIFFSGTVRVPNLLQHDNASVYKEDTAWSGRIQVFFQMTPGAEGKGISKVMLQNLV